MSTFGKIFIVVLLIALIVTIKVTQNNKKETPPAVPETTLNLPKSEKAPIPVTIMKETGKQKKAAPAVKKDNTTVPAVKKDKTAAPAVKKENTAVTVPVKVTKLPRLLELGSETCQPCRMMQTVLAELRSEYAGRLQVDYIDVYKDDTAAKKYKVQFIPVQVLFDAEGNEIYRHTGYFPMDKILAKFDELKVNL